MEINVKRIPGYDKIVQSLGGSWEDPVRPEVLESFVDANLNDLNSASMTAILNYCGEAGVTFLPLAQRISNYAEKSGIKHFVFDLSFLRVLSNNLKERPELDGEFSRRFDEFLKQNPLALSSTEVCKALVRDVARSSIWKKGFPLLGKLKAAGDVTWDDYYPLVLAAAVEGDLDVVLLLQSNFLQSKDQPPAMDLMRDAKTPNMSTIWSILLETINDMQDKGDPGAKVYMEKLLAYWRATAHVPHYDVIEKVASWFSKYNKDGAYDIWTNVEMPKNGVCPVTGNVLEKVHLIQYDKLQSEFLEKVLVKGNVWSNADPTDLKGLLQFVKQRAPFDVVIDGLNVSYHEMATDKSGFAQISQVLQVCKYIKTQFGMKVAVISREWWNRTEYRAIVTTLRKYADLYLTKQTTKDDLFSMYCCLESGPDCLLVSNDLLRDLRRSWRPALGPAFAHWQHMRQVHISYDDAMHKLALITPRQYATSVQKVDGTIYIPHHAVTEHILDTAHTTKDVDDEKVSVDSYYRIPNTFLVVSPKRQALEEDGSAGKRQNSAGQSDDFFQKHPLPEWASLFHDAGNQ